MDTKSIFCQCRTHCTVLLHDTSLKAGFHYSVFLLIMLMSSALLVKLHKTCRFILMWVCSYVSPTYAYVYVAGVFTCAFALVKTRLKTYFALTPYFSRMGSTNVRNFKHRLRA